MVINKLKNNFPLLFIIFLCLFYAVNNYLWLKLNQCPPVDDEAYHLESSLECYDILVSSPRNAFTIVKKLFDYCVREFYPPFFHILAAINNVVFGRTMIASVMTNIFFITVTFIGIYMLGKKLLNKALGILAVFIFAMYPIVFWLSRVFLLETALCAAVVTSMVWIVYTDNFKDKYLYAVLFGFILAIGMLIKQTFFFSAICPLIFAAVSSLSLRKDKISRNKYIYAIGISLLVGIAFAGAWYFPKLKFLLPKYIHAGYLEGNRQNTFVFSLDSITFYIKMLFLQHLLPYFTALFFISFIVFMVSENRFKKLLAIWIASALVIFTLIRTKTAYYTVPILPAVALISSYGLLSIKNKLLRFYLICFFIIFGLWQFYYISFGNEGSLVWDIKTINSKLDVIYFMPVSLGGKTEPYAQRGNWMVEDMISLINNNQTIRKRPVILVTHLDGNFLGVNRIPWRDNNTATNKDMLKYIIQLKRLPYSILNIYGSDYRDYGYRKIPVADFVISMRKIEELGVDIPGNYNLLNVFTMPDKSLVYVYKNSAHKY